MLENAWEQNQPLKKYVFLGQGHAVISAIDNVQVEQDLHALLAVHLHANQDVWILKYIIKLFDKASQYHSGTVASF